MMPVYSNYTVNLGIVEQIYFCNTTEKLKQEKDSKINIFVKKYLILFVFLLRAASYGLMFELHEDALFHYNLKGNLHVQKIVRFFVSDIGFLNIVENSRCMKKSEFFSFKSQKEH
jgi:hypothetical protein